MPKRQVIVELSPTRVELAVLRGAAVQTRASERLPGPQPDTWDKVLAAVGPVLKKLVAQEDAAGARATVIYSSPTAATGVFSCPRQAGTARAINAATLALAEAAGFPLESNASDLRIMATDRSSKGDAGSQTHTLAVADSDDTIKALESCVGSAGLEAESFLPVDAALLALAVTRALELSSAQTSPVVLYIGEHTSVLAAGSGGRLKFARQISLGTESLVEAISREMRTSEGTVTLKGDEARQVLATIGIPGRDQVVLERPRVTGDAVLPMVQPLLQRWVVEIRQSLRFGLDEAERSRAAFHTLGPGAAVPRLPKIIADQLGVKVAEQADPSATAGAIDALVSAAPGVSLVPRRTHLARAGSRLRRAMIIGASAAAVMIFADATLTRAELSRREGEVRQNKARLDELRAVTALRDRVTAEQQALGLAKKRAAAKIGDAAPWDAAMVMLSRKTPRVIRLVDVNFTIEGGRPVARLSGIAPMLDRGAEGTSPLKTYMDSLSQTPIVRLCRLGATQRIRKDGGDLQSFEMTLTLVPFPSDLPPTNVKVTSAPAGEETR